MQSQVSRLHPDAVEMMTGVTDRHQKADEDGTNVSGQYRTCQVIIETMKATNKRN